MYYNVSTVFDRTNQIRSAEGIVNHQREAVFVSYFRKGIDICNVTVWVAQGFQEDCSGVICNGTLDFLKIMGVNKCGCNSVLWKGVSQKIVGSAVDCLLCNNMTAVCSQSLNGVADSCST